VNGCIHQSFVESVYPCGVSYCRFTSHLSLLFHFYTFVLCFWHILGASVLPRTLLSCSGPVSSASLFCFIGLAFSQISRSGGLFVCLPISMVGFHRYAIVFRIIERSRWFGSASAAEFFCTLTHTLSGRALLGLVVVRVWVSDSWVIYDGHGTDNWERNGGITQATGTHAHSHCWTWQVGWLVGWRAHFVYEWDQGKVTTDTDTDMKLRVRVRVWYRETEGVCLSL
jgi:hypothetical protein